MSADDFVGVHPLGDGRAWIYVGVSDAAHFDAIPRPVLDHRAHGGNRVLTKTVEHGGVSVIFQHGLEDSRGAEPPP